MKKVMLSLGVVAAAALSLVSCQKEISNPDENPAVKGTPFEIIATSADTKTVNKDLATEWAGGESINLFYAAAGETTYNNGGEFNTTDAGTSVKFNGTLDASKLGDSNDWYAFYPYSSYITTPANTSNGYSVVGSKFNAAQTQDGIDSKAHLAGDNLPMYAIASGVEKGTIPELAFHHLSSVIKVHVTNSTAEALTVSSVSFTAPEDIVGTYFIDFSSETPSYTASDAEKKYVSSTATLNVTSAEIAAGAAADFYLAIKPFTAKAGSTLKLAVNGNEKAIELTNDVTFTAGNIKPLKFDYNIVAEDYSGTYLLLNGDKTKVCPAFASGNNISAVDYTSENIDDSWVMTIKKISGSTMYTIQDANGMYLSTGATKDKNYMVGLNDADKSRSSWAISLGADGNYSIVATNSSYRNILRYNPTNDLFACYSSGQNPVTLVKYTLLPSLEKPEVVASANPANNGIDVIWSDVENATKYVVTCTGQTDQIINPGVMATSFSGLTDGDYVVTVTATAEGYKPATATAESIHIGLASRNLKFTDNSKTLGFNEEYTNTLSGETSGVKFSIINAEGNAPSESEIGYFDTETGELLTGTVAGTYTITATAPATTEYAAGTASYTLIVKEDNYETDGTLATWIFTNDNYPANKTDFINNGVSDKYTGCTFNLNGSGSTWNTGAGKGYAFTAVTDITIIIKASNTLKKGAKMILSMNSFYNKASNAPVKGFNIIVKEGDGIASTTGCDKTSWSLTASSSNYTVTYTLQNDVEQNDTISFILTQTGKAGAGQGYVNNVKVEYNN